MKKASIKLGNIKLKYDAPEVSTSKNFKPISFVNKDKYILKNPKKPMLGKLDTSKAKSEHLIIPEEMKEKMTQEEYELLIDSTFESCEELYRQEKQMIDHVRIAIDKIVKEDPKFHPYLLEVNKFKVLVDMAVNDCTFLLKELESIRKLYFGIYTDKKGKTLEGIDYQQAFTLSLITDIKLRYLVCGNRIRALVSPVLTHLSDFYSSMKVHYYTSGHEDEAPDDIKKFIKEELKLYTNTEVPVQ